MNLIDKILLEALEPKKVQFYIEKNILGICGNMEDKFFRNKPGYKRQLSVLMTLAKHIDLDKLNDIWEAASRYQSNQYARMNNSLRDNKTPKNTNLIDLYIQYAPKSTNDILYRGVGRDYFNHLKTVKGFSEPSFTSITSDERVAVNFSKKNLKGGVLVISGCSGKAAIAPPDVFEDENYGEDEYYLPRNTKFKVLEITDTVIKVKII